MQWDDRNTTYFHLKETRLKKKNHIKLSKDEKDNWIEN